MRIDVIGGGPAGLYFATLMKQADPRHRIRVIEQNPRGNTYGFGVVFSDQTISDIREADPETYRRITNEFVHWDDIDIHYEGQVLSSTGHGFAGMSRHKLMQVLQDRAEGLGVELTFDHRVESLAPFRDADLVVAADGVNSGVRDNLLADEFDTAIDVRPNRFVWLGTTKPFPAFTFYFRENDHGLWRAHCYQYAEGESTFLVEIREETWRSAGMDEATEAETIAYLEDLFADELDGHPLIGNKSVWRQFHTVSTKPWHADDVVLIGDAAHTAHFSVGSGTRMAMMDSISLADALARHDASERRTALQEFEEERRPAVESLQRAAQASLQWFEDTERYMDLEPTQFSFSLLTRSLRITHEDLRVRDEAFLTDVNDWFARSVEERFGCDLSTDPSPPPMFTPYRLRDMELENRIVVSPMCQYSADDGTVDDWHLVHLGSRAVGGAGLVMAEMTDVSRQGRITYGCAGLYKEEHVPAWKRVVDFVHDNSFSKIGIQLGHSGRKGATKLLWEGGETEPLPEEMQWELVAPSPVPYVPDRSPMPREMTRSDMDAILEDYVRAARYALRAGFDLLEVHMAHGYLLAEFISPLTNDREDRYGGPLENRMRFPLEVFDACREVWPDHKPMSVRISATDWKPGGMTPEDSVEVARMLEAHNCDIVDISAGQTVPDQEPEYGRLFQTPFSDQIRHEVGIDTMAVGNISSYMDVNTILAAGRADLCCMARAHLYDPYWTRHAAYTLDWDLEWPDQYKSIQDYTPRMGFDDEAEVPEPRDEDELAPNIREGPSAGDDGARRERKDRDRAETSVSGR